jgi:hypothetical protein
MTASRRRYSFRRWMAALDAATWSMLKRAYGTNG